MIERGEIWWADPGEPASGSSPGFARPVVIIQADWVNKTRLPTAVVASISSNVRLASLRGNILISARESGLPKPSVIVVSQLMSLDQRVLRDRVGMLPPSIVRQLDQALRLFLDL